MIVVGTMPFDLMYSICFIFSATCGGRFAGTSGTITSPNYPNSYDTNADCTWVVEGPAGHYLTFTFTQFTTESAQNCTSADYVEIREINSTGKN